MLRAGRGRQTAFTEKLFNDTGEKGTGMSCSRDGMRVHDCSFAIQEDPFYPVPVWRGQRWNRHMGDQRSAAVRTGWCG